MKLTPHNGYTLFEVLFTLAIFAVSIIGFRIWVDAMGEAWDIYTTVRGFEDVRDKVYAYYYQNEEWPDDILKVFLPPLVVPSTRSGENVGASYKIVLIERWALGDPDRPHWYDGHKHGHLQVSVEVSTGLMANKICAMLGPLTSVGSTQPCDAPATNVDVPVNLRIPSPGVTAIARYAYVQSGELEMLKQMRVEGNGLFDLCLLMEMSPAPSDRICGPGYAMGLTHEIPEVEEVLPDPDLDPDTVGPQLPEVPAGQLLECTEDTPGVWVWEPLDGDGVPGAPDFWQRLQDHNTRKHSGTGC